LKTGFVKAIFLLIIVSSSLGNKIYASAPNAASDTSKKMLLAENIINKQVVLKEANVLFPEIISGHEEQSLDYIEKFANNRRSYLLNIFTKAKRYFPKAKSVLAKYNVPEEYVILMALESGFNGNAVSSAGAVGYWQFMGDVAREYGLKVGAKKVEKKTIIKKGKKVTITKKRSTVDDRKNFMKSTIAAAHYLQDRMRNLNNDWLLVAASYNCGVGNVWDAMKRTGLASPGFWDIKKYLPAETKAYVMNFITLNVIAHNYENFKNNNLNFRPVLADAPVDALNIALPSVVFMD
jgi:membrane-bound lytic murein transglycosylase D